MNNLIDIIREISYRSRCIFVVLNPIRKVKLLRVSVSNNSVPYLNLGNISLHRVQNPANLTLTHLRLTQHKREVEIAPYVYPGLNSDLAAKLQYHLFANVQTQADSSYIHLFGRLQEPKQLEQLHLVFWLYSNALITD
jgi:hypothetical protein